MKSQLILSLLILTSIAHAEDMIVRDAASLVSDNKIVFRRAQVQIDVNIGDGTEPESFRFERNQWFAEDRPQSSKPRLPSAEVNGVYGVDPR